MDQYSVGRFREQNPIQPFQPRELSEVEKERILNLTKVFAIDTATQSEIEPYYRNMVSQLRVGGLGIIDTPIPPSSSPFAEKKEKQLPPEFFTNLAISSETAKATPSEPTAPKTDEEKLSFFQRFSRKTGGRSDIEEQAQKDFGDVGALSMDKSGNFRLGTMGFYESSAAGSYAGSRLELLTSNQGVVASSNRLYNSTSLFETSPAWKPKVEQIPGWNAKTNEQGDVYYTDRSGNPVTFGSLGSSLVGNDPDEPVGPNSIIGYENGNPVLAKDAMPILATVTKLGLETYLRRNEFEESFYNYNLDANNNWTRYKRAGDYGAADPSVLGFVDPNNVPIVDFLFSTISGTTTNPDEVARELSPKINANLLVDLIIERDPELYVEMVKAGADPNTLRSMQTAGEFRGYVNRVFINNSISRSLSTIEKTDGWWWDKFYKGSDMLQSTLISGDFVGQLGITVASGGTNLLVAGGLRATAMASARTAATGATRTAALRTAIGGSTRVASEVSRATSNVVRWLPANIPTTLLEKTLSRLPSASNYIQNLKWYTRLPARGGIWTLSQGAEGFVEEGFTDIVNQNYEIALGLRESFDWEQLYHSSVEGALMEPVLGGIIGGASIPVHLSGRAVSKGVVNRVASIFNLSKSRMQELSLYMDTLNGKYENLSPIQQQIRLEQVVRGIVLEDTLGSVSEGRLSRAETAIPVLSQIAGQLRSTEGAISTGNLMEAGVLVSKVAEGLQTNYNADPTSLKDLMEAGIVSKDTGNGVKFTEDGAISLLTLVGAGMRADTRTNALTIMARESTNKAIKEHILKVNSELAKKLKDAQQSGKAADLAQAESDLNKALSDFLNSTDENDKKIVDSISGNTDKRMKLITSLLEQTFVREGIETVLNQDTQDSIETSNARLSSRFGNFFMQLQDILDAPARKREEARQARIAERIAERRRQDLDRMAANAQTMAEESARGLQTGEEELKQAQQGLIDRSLGIDGSLALTVDQPATPAPTVAPAATEAATAREIGGSSTAADSAPTNPAINQGPAEPLQSVVERAVRSNSLRTYQDAQRLAMASTGETDFSKLAPKEQAQVLVNTQRVLFLAEREAIKQGRNTLSTSTSNYVTYATDPKLYDWNAQWVLASVAKQQGVDLSTLTREQYVQFAIDNGLRITDNQLRMATTLRNATSMAEYQALRKSMRSSATPQQQQADTAFDLFAQQIQRDAATSKQIANGIRIRSGTAKSNTWLYFKINGGANTSGVTHKAYAGFENIYSALTPDKVKQFMELLQSRGYNGDIKTVQNLDQGSQLSDQIVMHGATEADAQLGQQLSREFFGNELTFSEIGMDSATQSYSQILEKKIESEITKQLAIKQSGGAIDPQLAKYFDNIRKQLKANIAGVRKNLTPEQRKIFETALKAAATEAVTPPTVAEPAVTPVIASTAPAEPVVTAPSTPITSPDPVTESQVYSKEDAAAAAELENLGYTKDEVGRFKQLLEANNLSLTYVLSLIEDIDDINDKKELLNSLTKPC